MRISTSRKDNLNKLNEIDKYGSATTEIFKQTIQELSDYYNGIADSCMGRIEGVNERGFALQEDVDFYERTHRQAVLVKMKVCEILRDYDPRH